MNSSDKVLFLITALATAAACGGGSGDGGGDPADTSPHLVSSGPTDTTPPKAARPPAIDGRECGIGPVTGRGIGDVAIGMSESDLRGMCTIIGDTTVPGPEGMPSRVMSVGMGGETVDVEIADGRVWRIPVTDAHLRTDDSLGVGTPLARLLELPGVTPAAGEGMYVMSPAHCGISFQIRNPRGALPAAMTAEQLRQLPPGVVVSRMLVTGCKR